MVGAQREQNGAMVGLLMIVTDSGGVMVVVAGRPHARHGWDRR